MYCGIHNKFNSKSGYTLYNIMHKYKYICTIPIIIIDIQILTPINVTGMMKTGLPHTSNEPTFTKEQAIDLNFTWSIVSTNIT